MLIIELLIGMLVGVAFIITFLLGVGYGQNRIRKTYSDMLIKQHACLNWAMQWIFPPLEKKCDPWFADEMARWEYDRDYAEKVAEGDIDAILSKE